MRKVLYVVILLLLMAAPVEKLDVAHLEPVEVVHLGKKGNIITMTTDTGAKGQGRTVSEALADLKENTPAVVYLDTARYLLVSEAALDAVEESRSWLKGSVQLCLAEEPNMEIAANYLETHGNLPTLEHWSEADKLPQWDGEKQ